MTQDKRPVEYKITETRTVAELSLEELQTVVCDLIDEILELQTETCDRLERMTRLIPDERFK